MNQVSYKNQNNKQNDGILKRAVDNLNAYTVKTTAIRFNYSLESVGAAAKINSIFDKMAAEGWDYHSQFPISIGESLLIFKKA